MRPLTTITTAVVPIPTGTRTLTVHWHVTNETFDRLLPGGCPVRVHDDHDPGFRVAHFQVHGYDVIMYGSVRDGIRVTVDTVQEGWQG